MVLIAVNEALTSSVRDSVTKAGADPELLDQPSNLVGTLQQGAYAAVILQAPRWSERAAILIQTVVSVAKGAPVLLLVDQADFRSVRDALRCGVSDALFIPDEISDLTTVLREQLGQFSIASRVSSQGVRQHGRVCAVYSAKGGSGRTLLAANLVLALAEAGQGQIALVDLNLQFGGVEGVLDLKPERSIMDLLPVLNELGDVHLRNVATTHSSGIAVSCSPGRISAPQLFGYEQTKLLIKGLRTFFDQIVFDCSSAVFPATEAALKLADQVLYVLTPDSLALRQLKAVTDQWSESGLVDRARIRLVLNRASSNSEIECHDITEITGLPIVGQVRANFASIQPLINVGMPLIHQQKATPNSPIVRDIKNLALRLAKAQEKE